MISGNIKVSGFTKPGAFKLGIKLTDEEGASREHSFVVNVRFVQPPIEFSSLNN